MHECKPFHYFKAFKSLWVVNLFFVFCRSSSSWKDKGVEDGSKDDEKDGIDKTQNEETKNEERTEIKNISDFNSAQTQLHARTVACETENALLLLHFTIMQISTHFHKHMLL